MAQPAAVNRYRNDPELMNLAGQIAQAKAEIAELLNNPVDGNTLRTTLEAISDLHQLYGPRAHV